MEFRLEEISMTLLDIRNQLIAHFCVHDTLQSNQLAAFQVENSLQEYQESLVKTALNDLASAGIVRYIAKDENKGFWIATQPLGLAGQEIGISLPTATRLAIFLNSFIAAQEESEGIEEVDAGNKVDALNLDEAHLVALLEIADHLRATE